MIRKLRIFLLFCLPSVCYADGVSVQAWTLASSPFAFLVKVIALDNARFKAKVKIIKKFHSSINLTDQSPAIYPAAFFDRTDNVEVHTVSWNDLNLQSEFTLNLNRPTEAVAGKWVIEEQYWDQAEVPKIDSSAYIVANNRGTWTWVKTTPFTEKKFQLFYDLKQRDHELKSLSESKLLPWLKDEDLKSYALLELENRNAIGPKLFLTEELKEKYHWILRDYLDKKDNTTQKKVINTFYEYLLKEKVNELFIVNFLNLFNYLPPGLLSFDQEVQLGSLLKYQKNEGSSSFHPVNEAIKAIHRKIKDKAIGSHYIKVSEQILDAFKYESSPTIRPTDVYSATSLLERQIFLRKQAKQLQEDGFSTKYSDYFSAAAFKLQTEPDLTAALSLIKLDLTKAQTNIKVAILEAVFEAMTQFEDMSNLKKRQELILFMDKYIDPKIPTCLNESIMKRYHSLKNK